jgi:hypothetical protein
MGRDRKKRKRYMAEIERKYKDRWKGKHIWKEWVYNKITNYVEIRKRLYKLQIGNISLLTFCKLLEIDSMGLFQKL